MADSILGIVLAAASPRRSANNCGRAPYRFRFGMSRREPILEPPSRVPTHHLIDGVVLRISRLGGNPGMYAKSATLSKRPTGIDLHHSFWCLRGQRGDARTLTAAGPLVTLQVEIATGGHQQWPGSEHNHHRTMRENHWRSRPLCLLIALRLRNHARVQLLRNTGMENSAPSLIPDGQR